ncbi:hypothetical protein D3C79_962740 [compost metagenome]
MGQLRVRDRALVPMTRPQSAMASSSVGTMRALASTSLAPAARAMASSSGKACGSTNTSCVSPMVFMALAADPMLPV